MTHFPFLSLFLKNTLLALPLSVNSLQALKVEVEVEYGHQTERKFSHVEEVLGQRATVFILYLLLQCLTTTACR